MENVRQCFEKNGHTPSADHYEGLQQVAKNIELMAIRASGVFDLRLVHPDFAASYYLSFLPAGMGKTSVLIESIRALLERKEYERLGVIVFLSRREEIQRLS